MKAIYWSVLAVAASWTFAYSADRARAELWDVDFGSGATQSGKAVFGLSSDPAWNAYSGSSGTGLTITNTAGGHPLTLDYSATSNYTDTGGTAMDSATTPLMEDYLYNSPTTAGNPGPSFTIHGVADNTGYKLVVYAAGDSSDQGTLGITANGQAIGGTSATSREISAGEGVAYEEAYVESDASGNLVVNTFSTGNYSAVNGFQLQIVPEPSSIMALVGLCGIGLIGLIVHCRRAASRPAA